MFTYNWPVQSLASWYQLLNCYKPQNMLHAIQFTRNKSHLYSRMRSQKLKISTMWRVKHSLNTQQHLAIYTSVASKNAGMQRVKTPMKTLLLHSVGQLKPLIFKNS